MSDYLSTLAARSLNLAPVAAPRVNSLFDPGTPAGETTPRLDIDTPADAAAEIVRGTNAPAIVETRPPAARPTVTMPAAPAASSRPDNIAPQHLHLLGNEQQRANAPMQQPIAGTMGESVPPSITPRSMLLPAATPAPLPEPDATRDRFTDIDRGPAGAIGLEDVVIPLTANRLAALERLAEERASEDSEREPPGRPPLEAVRPTVRVVEAGGIASSNAARVASDVAKTAAPVPVVRVTIGRIEVRAVTAAPPAPPQKPAAPLPAATTPLDDYLKQRSAGRR